MTKTDVVRAKRDAIKSKPGIGQTYRFFIFLLGFAFISLGIGLIVLPGPLTIPPLLLGLWIWSTEFKWAERFFDVWQEKGKEAWVHAKARPKRAAFVTIFGLAIAGGTIFAVTKYDLVSKATDFIGS